MSEKDGEYGQWFAANKTLLETAYLAADQPWQQSGVGLHSACTYERWEAMRRPIAACVTTSGTLLDMGCANGYLLECLLRWVGERDLTLEPYGLDISEGLLALARQRLPQYADHCFVGNAWDWPPPRRFDYVRTELVYVPDELQQAYVRRLLTDFLTPTGSLLVAEYRARGPDAPPLRVEQRLAEMGFPVPARTSGFWQGVECTRIAVVPAA
ncbi:MAG: class I SAM-dependent methyltransferase [Ktedonobacterales bacterium]